MSEVPLAPVFRQDETEFEAAAGLVHYNGLDSLTRMLDVMRDRSPGLHLYLMRFVNDIVHPLNPGHDTDRPDEGSGERAASPQAANVHAFMSGTVMTFSMIEAVHQHTGAEIPEMPGNVEMTPPGTTELDLESDTPLIDLFYRGTDFRDRLPHVYRPSLILMKDLLFGHSPEVSVSDMEADMGNPVSGNSMGPDQAMRQLHFAGGAAEAALTLENFAYALALEQEHSDHVDRS
ncbi:MAG TPA: hypothetical protein VFX84_03725 [Candidatus Saccharimonadales bacterium]|nr:hypothetical protein [Candidatus Saccharimonadales bacterium]